MGLGWDGGGSGIGSSGRRGAFKVYSILFIRYFRLSTTHKRLLMESSYPPIVSSNFTLSASSHQDYTDHQLEYPPSLSHSTPTSLSPSTNPISGEAWVQMCGFDLVWEVS